MLPVWAEIAKAVADAVYANHHEEYGDSRVDCEVRRDQQEAATVVVPDLSLWGDEARILAIEEYVIFPVTPPLRGWSVVHPMWIELPMDVYSSSLSAAEAFWADRLRVDMAVSGPGAARCEFRYRVSRADQEVLRARTLMGFFDYAARRPVRRPADFLTHLTAQNEESDDV